MGEFETKGAGAAPSPETGAEGDGPVAAASPDSRPDSSIIRISERLGHAVLPAGWDAREDEGLYDDLI